MAEEKECKFDFEGVFNPEDYMYFYGDELTEDRTDREVEFLIDELGMYKPMSILDVGCGFGRHAIKLAEKGHRVTGIDCMEGFLCLARDQAQEKNLKINFINKDMRYVEFNGEFERAILMFTTFGYFTDDQNLKVLKNISRALDGHGLFCFDTFNRDAFLKDFIPYFVHEKNEDFMIDRFNFDPKTGHLINNRIIVRDGKRKDTPFVIRLYDYNEIERLLGEAGMEIEKIYGDWSKSPFTKDSRGMKIIAKKI